MRRRQVLGWLGAAAGAPRAGFAQARTALARVGYLGPAPAANFALRVEALRAGLRDLGYVEGRNLVFEFRWADTPGQMPELAADLVRRGVDVIFAQTSTETAAALEATRTVPIVFAGHADPVGLGHVASLAHPGGNATGITVLLTELIVKQIEALMEALPGAKRFGVLFTPSAPSHARAREAAEAAASRLGLDLRHAAAREEGDLDGVLADLSRDAADGLVVVASSFTLSRRRALAELAIRHRLPSSHGARDNVLAGGLMSYAPDASETTRRAAIYVDRILRDGKPADLPVEQASRYGLVVNLKTAAALSLTIPSLLLARADEVIE